MHLFSGAGLGPGMVLCIGWHGDLALEPAHEDGGCGGHRECPEVPEPCQDDHSCVDVLVTGDPMSRSPRVTMTGPGTLAAVIEPISLPTLSTAPELPPQAHCRGAPQSTRRALRSTILIV